MNLVLKKRFPVILVVLMLRFQVSILAQLDQGGVPLSFRFSLPPENRGEVVLDPPSLETIRIEDMANPLPYRFAVNLPLDVDIEHAGTWITAPDGSVIWRITLHAPGALGITLYFDRFSIPEGGRFFVYSPSRTRLLGAFTSLNNNRFNTFATSILEGDRITLEYNCRAGISRPGLHISELAYAYRGIPGRSGDRTGFGSAGKCQVNVACTEGDSWQLQKRSIARVEVKRGTASVWCSGLVVNNTKNDGTPYLLTADHCGRLSSPQDLSQWIFYFDYQGTTCPNPATEPRARTMTGATLISHGGDGGSTGSDFFLVKFLEAIPDSFRVYYSGWSRETTASPTGVGIHHPQGDIKKISTYTQPLVKSTWNSHSNYTHWRVIWANTAHGHGTTEGGSSGSPIYDNLGRLVGTLTGGDSACDSAHIDLPDYYGMFSYHWDQNGTDSTSVLKYWLDPINSGVMTLNGWAVGTEDPDPVGDLSVYPNPATGFLVIDFGGYGITRLSDLTIMDLQGKVVFSCKWNPIAGTLRIPVSGWLPGMYLLRVFTNGSSTMKKIIKL